jgi:poly(A) polymerase
LLRAGTGDADPELAQWWTDFQEADNERKKEMVRLVQDVKKRGRRRKKPTVRDKGVVTS